MISRISTTTTEAITLDYTKTACKVSSKAKRDYGGTVEIGKFKNFIRDIGYTGDIENVSQSDIESLIQKFGQDIEFLTNMASQVDDIETMDLQEMEDVEVVEESKYSLKRGCPTKKYTEIKKEKDSMYISNMDNKEVSINSLYTGCFVGTPEISQYNYTDRDIENILNKNGLSITTENMWGASKLLSYGVDVSQTSLAKIQNIKAAVDSLEQQEQIKEDFKENTKIDLDAPIIKDDKVLYSKEDVSNVKELLENLSPEQIKEAGTIKDVSINGLRKLMHENTEKVIGPEIKQDISANEIIEIDPQSEELLKSSIETIRTKLTVEAAQKLSGEMSIEFAPLVEVAKELISQETEQISKAIKAFKLDPSTELIEEVRKTTSAVQLATKNFPLVPVTQSVTTLENMEGFVEKYLANETKASSVFKEGFNKIQDQVTDLLQSLNVEVTELNLKSAKALIVNNMEVTPVAIDETGVILNQIETFLDEMTPHRTVELLNSGINPYTTEVSKILDWIGDKAYPNMKENVAEMILDVESRGMATPQQKEALMGIYRVLDGVTKNKEAITGYLYKNNGFASVEKFNEALKTMKKHIEVKVDDSIGPLAAKNTLKKQTGELVQTVQQEALKEKEFFKGVEQLELKEIYKEKEIPTEIKGTMYSLLKQYIKAETEALGISKTIPVDLAEKLEYIQGVDSSLIKRMNESEIPLSIFNLFWTKKILDKSELSNTKKDLTIDNSFPKDVKELNEQIEKLIEETENLKSVALKNGDLSQYQTKKETSEQLLFEKSVLNRQGIYQIPFVINGEVRTVNLHLEKKAAREEKEIEETKATLTYQTSTLGKIKAQIVFKGNEIGYEVIASNTEANARLTQENSQLKAILEELGKVVVSNAYKIKAPEYRMIEKRGGSLFEEII